MSDINFETDQEEVLDRTANIDKLANKIKEMQAIQKDIEQNEEYLKQRKKDLEQVSGEAIPTMLSEMGLSYLKLADGSSVEVKTNYSATITQANKEKAFNWLRENGLGDIIKNELTAQWDDASNNLSGQDSSCQPIYLDLQVYPHYDGNTIIINSINEYQALINWTNQGWGEGDLSIDLDLDVNSPAGFDPVGLDDDEEIVVDVFVEMFKPNISQIE